jgi:phosphosulfolactate phosphohydrolase-like enzyme
MAMRFSRLFLNRADNQSTTADTVVVIDVLRSFTTAAVALAQGALAVYPVEDPTSMSNIPSEIDRDGDEDIACADYIESLLRGESKAPEAFALRVRQSDFGSRFAAGSWPNLPTADLEIVAQTDLFGFAMPVHNEAERLVIRQNILPS